VTYVLYGLPIHASGLGFHAYKKRALPNHPTSSSLHQLLQRLDHFIVSLPLQFGATISEHHSLRQSLPHPIIRPSQPHFSNMSSVDRSTNGQDHERLAPLTADGTPTNLHQDGSYRTAYSYSHTARTSNPGRSTQGPGKSGAQSCIAAACSFWPNVSVHHYIDMETARRVTEIVIPKEEPTPGFVLIVATQDGYDEDASSLVVNRQSGQERSSFAQLGSIDCVYEVTANNESNGWLGYGDEMNLGSCVAQGAILWGVHDLFPNPDGTKSFKYYNE
jgi:hypothetical protein